MSVEKGGDSVECKMVCVPVQVIDHLLNEMIVFDAERPGPIICSELLTDRNQVHFLAGARTFL